MTITILVLALAGIATWSMIVVAAIACGRAAAQPWPKRPRAQRFRKPFGRGLNGGSK